MTDFYLLLTPLLVIGVMGLVRFIGCDKVFGLVEVKPTIPTILDPIPGNQRVDVRWTYAAGTAESFTVMYGTVKGGPYPDDVTVTVTDDSRTLFTASVTGLMNGTTYYFVVTADIGEKTSENSVEVSATPDPGFVLQTMPGPGLRNDIQGFVGMAITIGANDVIVTHLGRIYFPGIPGNAQFPGNTQSHVVKIVEAAPGGMEKGSVTIQMPAGGENEYAFETLVSPATLQAGQQYYVVSEERDGGDFWYDLPNQSTTTNVALLTSGIFKRSTDVNFAAFGGVNQMYGPVNFRY